MRRRVYLTNYSIFLQSEINRENCVKDVVLGVRNSLQIALEKRFTQSEGEAVAYLQR
jgi:hypothetical protein